MPRHGLLHSTIGKMFVVGMNGGGGGLTPAERVQAWVDAVKANANGTIRWLAPLTEESGSVATDYDNTPQNGTYAGAGINVGGTAGSIPGTVAPQFDGADSYITLPAALWAYATGVDPKKGHMACRARFDELKFHYLFRAFAAADYRINFTSQIDGATTFTLQLGAGNAFSVTTGALNAGQYYDFQAAWADSNNGGFVRFWVDGVLAGQTTVTVAATGTTWTTAASAIGAAAPSPLVSNLDGALSRFVIASEPQGDASRAAISSTP